VLPGSGFINTVAGNGTFGYSGDTGAATNAQLYGPSGMAVDGSGNIYFADTGNNVVRMMVASTGIISTVAGNGNAGYNGDGGSGTSAELNYPQNVAVDGSGNIYIADTNNNVIRQVSAYTGFISTWAGNGTQGYTGDGGAATSAELNYPEDVAVDGSGNIYIADTNMNRLTMITYPDGTSGSFGYDYRGRRISATDQNGKTTTYAYDDADRLLSVTDPATHVTQYNYDTENNLLSITADALLRSEHWPVPQRRSNSVGGWYRFLSLC
jgi:YD repeat-containing protein